MLNFAHHPNHNWLGQLRCVGSIQWGSRHTGLIDREWSSAPQEQKKGRKSVGEHALPDRKLGVLGSKKKVQDDHD
jgi:hypothetical protein